MQRAFAVTAGSLTRPYLTQLSRQVMQRGQVPPVKTFRIELHLGSPDRWDRALTLNLGSEQSGPSFCPLLWPDASRIQRISQWEWYGVRSQSPSFCGQPVCTVPQVGREAGISQNPPVKAHGGRCFGKRVAHVVSCCGLQFHERHYL